MYYCTVPKTLALNSRKRLSVPSGSEITCDLGAASPKSDSKFPHRRGEACAQACDARWHPMEERVSLWEPRATRPYSILPLYHIPHPQLPVPQRSARSPSRHLRPSRGPDRSRAPRHCSTAYRLASHSSRRGACCWTFIRMRNSPSRSCRIPILASCRQLPQWQVRGFVYTAPSED